MSIYDSIPALTGFLSDPGRNGIGALGERLASRLLEKQGYAVTSVSRQRGRGDLCVVNACGEVFYIDVKTARQNRDGKWRFLLWKKHEQDYHTCDYLLLLAVLKTGDVVPYVIPVADLDHRSQIRITSHPRTYTGRWSAYRQSVSRLALGGQYVPA